MAIPTISEVTKAMSDAEKYMNDNAEKDDNGKTVSDYAANNLGVFIDALKNLSFGRTLKTICEPINNEVNGLLLMKNDSGSLWLRTDGVLVDLIKSSNAIKELTPALASATYGAETVITAIHNSVKNRRDSQKAKYDSDTRVAKLQLA